MTAAPRDYPPIVVLLGGPSAEHDVSVVSGTAIAVPDTIETSCSADGPPRSTTTGG